MMKFNKHNRYDIDIIEKHLMIKNENGFDLRIYEDDTYTYMFARASKNVYELIGKHEKEKR